MVTVHFLFHHERAQSSKYYFWFPLEFVVGSQIYKIINECHQNVSSTFLSQNTHEIWRRSTSDMLNTITETIQRAQETFPDGANVEKQVKNVVTALVYVKTPASKAKRARPGEQRGRRTTMEKSDDFATPASLKASSEKKNFERFGRTQLDQTLGN